MTGPSKQRAIYALKNEVEGGITLLIASANNQR